MLTSTFLHLPGYTERQERALWREGVKSWDDFLDKFGDSGHHIPHCSVLKRSKLALNAGNAGYFSEVLPRWEHWRAFPDFHKVAYLDIETTGLSKESNELTVIGVFDGKRVRSYVKGRNLDDFVGHIKKYDLLVTFNGSVFDAPFIRSAMPGATLPAIHIDLRFLLNSLGLYGGLKKIEQRFNLEREDDLKGLNGYDAVLLWQKYVNKNDTAALDRLIRYNAADISNLKVLMDWAYREKKKKTGFA